MSDQVQKQENRQWQGLQSEEKYAYIQKIGEGSRAEIYLVQDKQLGKRWVLKRTGREAGRREAKIMKQITHRGIVSIADYWEKDDRAYLVMEYVEGITMEEKLRQCGRIPEAQVLIWGRELAGILHDLHRLETPVYYLDLKPENIMIEPDGRLKLIDFDAAVLAGNRELERESGKPGYRRGTYGYAAPEQLTMGQTIDGQTDVYALGMTLYAMLSGHRPCEPPYGLRAIYQWRQLASKGLVRLILRCTEADRNERYASAEAVLRQLGLLRASKRNRSRGGWEQKQSVFYSAKKYAGLFGVGLILSGTAYTGSKGYAQPAREEAFQGTADLLLLNLRNEERQKVLLQNGAVYQLAGTLCMEIPEEYLWPDSVVTVTVTPAAGAGRRTRQLYISKVPQEK